jgi:hypothetical protein
VNFVVNSEKLRICKEVAMACFNVISRYSKKSLIKTTINFNWVENVRIGPFV